MWDFTNFFSAIAKNGIFVLAIVVGLTKLLDAFGIKGKWQLLSGVLLGLIVGGLFQIAGMGMPVNFAEWFSVCAYGFIMGLTAVGLYDAAVKIVAKGINQGNNPQG